MPVQIDECVQQQTTNGDARQKIAADGIWHVPPLESGDRLTRAEFERR